MHTYSVAVLYFYITSFAFIFLVFVAVLLMFCHFLWNKSPATFLSELCNTAILLPNILFQISPWIESFFWKPTRVSRFETEFSTRDSSLKLQ